MTQPDLTPADLEVLEFERAWWKYLGRKESVVRERFGTTLTRHTQRVLHVVAHPQAAAYNPQLVARLTRRQIKHRAARTHGMTAATREDT